MASEMLSVEVWIVVDESGDYEVGKELDQAAEYYAENIGGGETYAKRQVKVTLQIPKPAPIELTGTVPAEPEGATLTVA